MLNFGPSDLKIRNVPLPYLHFPERTLRLASCKRNSVVGFSPFSQNPISFSKFLLASLEDLGMKRNRAMEMMNACNTRCNAKQNKPTGKVEKLNETKR